ncbi:helix-turn-helix domain-containing protein [Roseivirga sp.]|uniref:helix-turn-helix domain-containing protein n=1 Tax=Roseivirga sp. TaxID=1964215 RepID=UPI002B269FF4|nr:helix-turn-helix domain-containing protein [Roseivirga sp.]
MQLSIINILQLLLVFQSVVFMTFLLSQGRGKYISNSLLAIFLFVLAVHMISNFAFDLNLLWPIPDLTNSYGFLYGPLIFLYIKSLVYKDFQLALRNALHLLPWLIILSISYFTTIPIRLSGISILISFSTYLIFSFRLIKRFHLIIKNTQSRFDSIALLWMQRFLYGLIFITLVDTIHNLIVVNNLVMENLFYGFLITALLFFVTSLVFHGLRQPELFQGVSVEDEALVNDAASSYTSSKLSQKEIDSMAELIQSYFNSNQPHRDPDLNIQKLAESMNLSSRTISEVINRYYKQNFSDFVNSFRIQEAISLLKNSNDKTTVLEILYAVGFNSKSSFYTAFKIKMGMTPSEFKKSLQ